MKVSELKAEYFLFGNRVNVLNRNAHIAKSDSHITLCGVPMLSSNHAKLNNMQYAECIECNIVYKEQNP